MANDTNETEKGLLLDHDYDGIRELDHPLPSWWLNLFYVTMIFSVFYVGYYMLGPGPTLRQELAAQMQDIEKAQAKAPKPADQGEAVLVAAIADPEQIKLGSGVYAGKCAACHGDKGQGMIGPNLTDDYWINGKGSPGDIAKVVSEGVAEKGMPPWGPVLKPEELVHVVAFIKSVRGSNPAGAKEAQGELQTN